MSYPIKSPRKLIEVALPLDKINEAAAREKSIRHGHPSTLHLWWARRPLAAARAVIFAQLVNDPGYQQGGGFKYGRNKREAAEERKRLFRIMEELVLWESTNNERVLEEARTEIRRSWREVCELNSDHPRANEIFNPDKMPGLHDPFAGGGAIPLEAQRLGLESFASDLNPVSVLINKAMIEIPPKFAGQQPVGPLPKGERASSLGIKREWPGPTGLAEDVRRYGNWMREEAQKRFGSVYPHVEISADLTKARPDLRPYLGQKLTVIAWVWARTVKSPNPAFSHIDVPLVSSFLLSTKEGKETYVQPVIQKDGYRFEIKTGPIPEEAKNGTKLARGANFRCVMSDVAIDDQYIKAESMAGRMGVRLMAIVAEGSRGRVYVEPLKEHESIAIQAAPNWKPEQMMNRETRDLVSGRGYGFFQWSDLFTSRQLFTLSNLSELVNDAHELVVKDAIKAGRNNDGLGLDIGGTGAKAYSDAIAVYLAFICEKLTESLTTICTWSSSPKNELIVSTFRRQALPMTWDFAEANPFADSSGSFSKNIEAIVKVMRMSLTSAALGTATQLDAQTQTLSLNRFISTDPPYYDNISYADLSDFFYVWLRKTLRSVFPSLFNTMAVPKSEELTATAYRHGSKEKAEAFFLAGMTEAMHMLATQAHPSSPITISLRVQAIRNRGRIRHLIYRMGDLFGSYSSGGTSSYRYMADAN
jgi:putative DNA methylase